MSQEDVMQAVYDDYRTGLMDLTFNSKPIITNLTIIASEQARFAKMIVRALEHHLDAVDPSIKLPTFYLLDSICKNNGQIYVSLFQPRVRNIFMKTFSKVSPEVQKNLERVLSTWYNMPNGLSLFPRSILDQIKNDISLFKNPNFKPSTNLTFENNNKLPPNNIPPRPSLSTSPSSAPKVSSPSKVCLSQFTYFITISLKLSLIFPKSSQFDSEVLIQRVSKILVKKQIQRLKFPNNLDLKNTIEFLQEIQNLIKSKDLPASQLLKIQVQLDDLVDSGPTTSQNRPPKREIPDSPPKNKVLKNSKVASDKSRSRLSINRISRSHSRSRSNSKVYNDSKNFASSRSQNNRRLGNISPVRQRNRSIDYRPDNKKFISAKNLNSKKNSSPIKSSKKPINDSHKPYNSPIRKNIQPIIPKNTFPPSRQNVGPLNRINNTLPTRKNVEPLKRRNNEPLNRPNHEPLNRPSNQPLNRLNNEPLDRPFNQPLNRLNNEPLNRSNNEPSNRINNGLLNSKSIDSLNRQNNDQIPIRNNVPSWKTNEPLNRQNIDARSANSEIPNNSFVLQQNQHIHNNLPVQQSSQLHSYQNQPQYSQIHPQSLPKNNALDMQYSTNGHLNGGSLNNFAQNSFSNTIQSVDYNNKYQPQIAVNQTAHTYSPNNLLIESLKAGGLYQNLSSFVPSLISSEVSLGNSYSKVDSINFDSISLKAIVPNAYKVLFTDYPSYCSQCGWRTSESPDLSSKPLMRAHLDWHFRNNRKQKENSRRRRPRGWFINQSLWLSEDSLADNSKVNSEFSPFGISDKGSNQPSGIVGDSDLKSSTELATNSAEICEKLSDKMVAIPEGHSNSHCIVCKEPFKSIWNENEEEWYYVNAVIVDGVIVHATCEADLKNVLLSPLLLKIFLIPLRLDKYPLPFPSRLFALFFTHPLDFIFPSALLLSGNPDSPAKSGSDGFREISVGLSPKRPKSTGSSTSSGPGTPNRLNLKPVVSSSLQPPSDSGHGVKFEPTNFSRMDIVS
ncbi:hypothetical protein AYI68_g4229 [Smittium mucronatum]|uniref:CID domain-containing protein n=1 Tax=Smittium mucronatum TaxID=133383 RepID=A0A1R0GXN3_9FUNG|nr:hypothetical protein AYI68_g4229 [Smittium mucronatum]